MTDTRNHQNTPAKIIGLIPTAGRATRLGPLPCSKEIYPIGFRPGGQGLKPKAAGHYLLEKMRRAGIEQAYIVLRAGKWDIPAYFRDGAEAGMRLGYVVVDETDGVPYTLDHAYPFVQDAVVALGFPDILFSADDAFVRLRERQERTGADIVLGLFPGDQPHKTDMVELDARGTVRRILIKPGRTDLKYTWGIALWTPRPSHDSCTTFSPPGEPAPMRPSCTSAMSSKPRSRRGCAYRACTSRQNRTSTSARWTTWRAHWQASRPFQNKFPLSAPTWRMSRRTAHAHRYACGSADLFRATTPPPRKTWRSTPVRQRNRRRHCGEGFLPHAGRARLIEKLLCLGFHAAMASSRALRRNGVCPCSQSSRLTNTRLMLTAYLSASTETSAPVRSTSAAYEGMLSRTISISTSDSRPSSPRA